MNDNENPPNPAPRICKSPCDCRAIHDHLLRKFRENPQWLADTTPDEARRELTLAEEDMERLHAWCGKWLTAEQIKQIQRLLHFVVNHRRVYKRTVLLSPRAHLLVKTLSDMDKLNMSEIVETHLDRVLRERHGLTLRTRIDERDGAIGFHIERLPSES
jgi:hypothetical protein